MWVKVREDQEQGHWIGGVEKRPGDVFELELPLTDEEEERIPEELADRLEEVEPPEDLPFKPPSLTLDTLNARIDELTEELGRGMRLPDPGTYSTGLVQFSQAAAPGCAITLSIAGIAAGEPADAENTEGDLETVDAPIVQHVYQEADTEDLVNGVWTNGADAAASAASFVEAINADERDAGAGAAQVSAMVVGDGTAALLYGYAAGHSCMYDITTDDGNIDVSDMRYCRDASIGTCYMIYHTVTDLDVSIGEIHVVLGDRPQGFALALATDSAGVAKASIPNGTLVGEENPDRLVYTFGNGDSLASGDHLNVLVQS